MKGSIALLLVLAAAPSAAAQQPQIQNAKVEVRKDTAIDRVIATVPSPPDQPVWVGWKAAMVDGDRDICNTFVDHSVVSRGYYFEDGMMTVSGDTLVNPRQRTPIAPSAGPASLEAGTQIIVLARVVENKIERLRTIGGECPMDGGGRTLHWLDAVTPAESIRFLTTLVRAGAPDRGLSEQERILADNAVRAIAYHRDAAADAVLDQVATDHREASIRRTSASLVASLRGARGAATLAKLIGAEKDVEVKRQLIASLGQSREASAVETFRGLLRDPEVKIRSEATHHYIIRSGAASLPEAQKMLASETDNAVKTRIVSAIGRLPADTSIPALLQLARGTDPVVRKQAASSLSQSKDPRAVAFMEQILKR